MKKNIFKKIPVIIALSVIFAACAQEGKPIEENPSPEVLTTIPTEAKPALPEDPQPATITIEKIDATQYNAAKQQAKPNKPVEKITDFKTVQKQLAGVVDFIEMEGYLGIKKINFRNGTTTGEKDQLDECSFVAYFPAEDILLLECGHTTDRSFDLTTRKETYDTGNPDLVTTSPTGKYRLNKIFEGQECYEHFLQENKQNKFQKIFELNKPFEKQFNKWLCVVEKEFWTDDYTLYFGLVTQYKEEGNEYEYYKVNITAGTN
ncbi:hypothetical protein [Polluticaenibacter yanchengensis]|uniref:Lipoprotein n=1 Tax=Polluticaenibacter yanchengensis TaxID=3014562 RepID=A0ABT4UF49_9BACT|nr:hypothetical protein [Chitinophagaceae bacterium LY-5]